MYAIEEGRQKINGEVVRTFGRSVTEGTVFMKVEAGTTGYRGGCGRNRNGRTYVQVLCLSGDFYFEPVMDDDKKMVGVTIACCGDEGLNAIMKALEFSHEAIDDQRCRVDD